MRCRHCLAEIEQSSGGAWRHRAIGTHRCYGVHGTLDSHQPDLSIEAIEEWLNA